MSKRTPGRPPLPDGERRDKRAYVAVTQDELDRIDAAARDVDQSRYEYLRRKIFEKGC